MTRLILGRLLTIGDRQKIEEFLAKFSELKEALTSRATVSSAIVTARMSELVDLTCAFLQSDSLRRS